jgi:HEPN domain-containing protein
MEPQDKYQYWLNHAQYDLKTADSMHQAGRWLYVVFMCQQSVEKLVKALYGLYLNFDAIPRTHNIRRLVNDFADKLTKKIPEDFYALFDVLSRFYINNRYPDYIDDLLTQLVETESQKILEQSKEVFAWLQTLKP